MQAGDREAAEADGGARVGAVGEPDGDTWKTHGDHRIKLTTRIGARTPA